MWIIQPVMFQGHLRPNSRRIAIVEIVEIAVIVMIVGNAVVVVVVVIVGDVVIVMIERDAVIVMILENAVVVVIAVEAEEIMTTETPIKVMMISAREVTMVGAYVVIGIGTMKIMAPTEMMTAGLREVAG